MPVRGIVRNWILSVIIVAKIIVPLNIESNFFSKNSELFVKYLNVSY